VINYHTNERRPHIFHMSSKYEKQDKSNTGSEVSCWVKNTYLYTQPFSSLSIRLVVVDSKETQISPISLAVTKIYEKNEELKKSIENIKIKEYRSDPKKLQEYQRILSGTLMAGVNGGVIKYKDVFLKTHDPTLEKDQIHKLKLVLQEHLRIVTGAVTQHRKYARKDKFHAQFEDFLSKMVVQFKDEIHYMRYRKLFKILAIFLIINIFWLVYMPNAVKEIIYLILFTITSYTGQGMHYFVQYLESLIGYEFPLSPVYNLGEILVSFLALIFNYWGQFIVGVFESISATVNIQSILTVTWDFLQWSFSLVKPYVENYLGDFGALLYTLFSAVIDKTIQEWTRFVISLYYC